MKIKVLLVDDEEAFVEPLSQRLWMRGFDVETALSGEAALDRIEETDVDVVVLDVLMQGKDGIETLKEIKKRRPLLQVIMLTGHAKLETAIDGMKAGAFDYLIKPIDVDELAARILMAFNQRTINEQRFKGLGIPGEK